jgi:dinuclear metal center YbgI/SA1388 family protein
MSTITTARDIANVLDALLETSRYPDYPGALNGLQLDHRGPVRRIATAVDFSLETIEATVAADANMLILHHGMFWGGVSRFVGPTYNKLQLLLAHDIAVYASHLPLDAHDDVGNCALLARTLQLVCTGRFGQHHGIDIGVQGESAVTTSTLLELAHTFAVSHGGRARASRFASGHITRRWAVITGAGADSATMRSAAEQGIDTLIVGEGPHHTTVDAPDYGIVVIFAGHYATETLGVRALADVLSERTGIPTQFLPLPTGS